MESSNNTYVAIMAGGIGSRFWPGSRVARPKQFLDILGVGKSLIRLTFERFLKLCPADHIYILTNAMYKDLVLEHLPELTEEQVLCEPSRNNTAPCVAYMAFKMHERNKTANFIVAPSDHIILNENNFIDTIKTGLDFTAENDALLTLGIQPNRPDTGYGYINYDKAGKGRVHRVVKFTEKPDLETAKSFLASGDYLWNAGIFVWSSQAILKAFREYAPQIFDVLAEGKDAYNTPGEATFINENYPKTDKISIDYAILEKADNVYTIPSEFGWSDLGTWASLHAELDKDEDQNVVTGGQAICYDSKNCLVRVPKGKLVVLKDMDDYIVVDEEDVLLIFPKSKEQEIKAVTQQLKENGAEGFL